MVVESMNHKEIIAEYDKDWKSEMELKVENILVNTNNTYRRYIMKNLRNEQFFFFKPIFLTSSRGNKYVLQISTRGWADFKKNNLLFCIYMYYMRNDGIHVVMPNWKSNSCSFDGFVFYTSHLFDRYREREMKDVNIPKMNAIIECIKLNACFRHKEIVSNKYHNSIFIVSPCGVMLGTLLEDGNKIMKTYLTFEMLKDQQIDDKNEMIERVLDLIKHLK